MTYNGLYEMLEHDPEKVKMLFNEYIENEDVSKFNEMKRELAVHMKSEEDFYYPKARKADESLVKHGIEEHNGIRSLIGALGQLGASDGEFRAKLMELKMSVEHHVDEEEHKLFPESKDVLSDNEEKEIARMFEEKKSKVL